MKRFIILIFLFGMISQNITYSQNNKKYLILTKIKNGKKYYIDPNKKIKIWVNQGETIKEFKGHYTIQDSITISIENHSININNIREVYSKTFLGKRIGNSILIVGSGLMIGSGIKFYYDIKNPGYLDYNFIISGLGILGGAFLNIVGIVSTNSKRYYNINDSYTLSID